MGEGREPRWAYGPTPAMIPDLLGEEAPPAPAPAPAAVAAASSAAVPVASFQDDTPLPDWGVGTSISPTAGAGPAPFASSVSADILLQTMQQLSNSSNVLSSICDALREKHSEMRRVANLRSAVKKVLRACPSIRKKRSEDGTMTYTLRKSGAPEMELPHRT